jgi:hypothetical protein
MFELVLTMFDLVFHSSLVFNAVQIIFLLAGIYVLTKKRLPAWFVGASRFAIEGSAVLPIGWALVAAAPLAVLLGLLLSYFQVPLMLLFLDPALIFISGAISILLVKRLKQYPDNHLRSNKEIAA